MQMVRLSNFGENLGSAEESPAGPARVNNGIAKATKIAA
jgi:hypothetical protein